VQFTFSSAEEDNAEDEFGRLGRSMGDAAMLMDDSSAMEPLGSEAGDTYRVTGAMLFHDDTPGDLSGGGGYQNPYTSSGPAQESTMYGGDRGFVNDTDTNASFASSTSGYEDRVVGNLSLSLDE
jgi:hypothetical protein